MVQDFDRQYAVPATGPEAGKQQARDYNLAVLSAFKLPIVTSWGINNAVEGPSYMAYNSTTKQFGGYLGNGLWMVFSGLADGLISVGGIVKTDNTVTVVGPVLWRIDGVDYEKNADTAFNVAYTASGNKRIDLIYADINNELLIVHGEESIGIAKPPTLPPLTVGVSYIYVFDNTITDPTPIGDGYAMDNNVIHQRGYDIETKFGDFVLNGILTVRSDADVDGFNIAEFINNNDDKGVNILVGQNNQQKYINFGYYGQGQPNYKDLKPNTAYVSSGMDAVALMINSLGTTPIVFCTQDSAEKMRLTPDGKLGVGLVSPAESIHTTGKIRVDTPPEHENDVLRKGDLPEIPDLNDYLLKAFEDYQDALINLNGEFKIKLPDGASYFMVVDPSELVSFVVNHLGQAGFGTLPLGDLWKISIKSNYAWTVVDDEDNPVFEMYSKAGPYADKRYMKLMNGTDIRGYSAVDTGERYRIDGTTGNATFFGKLNSGGTSEYDDNAAALAGGLTAGDIYRTGDILKIVH